MSKNSTKPPRQLSGGEIEVPETDRLMIIRTTTGPVELIGPKRDLMKFRDQLKDKDNRHTFIECPPHLLTWAPWLEGISVLPTTISVIVIQNKELSPKRKPGVLVPAGVGPSQRKLN